MLAKQADRLLDDLGAVLVIDDTGMAKTDRVIVAAMALDAAWPLLAEYGLEHFPAASSRGVPGGRLPVPGRRSSLDAHRDWLLSLVRQTSELTLVKIQVRLLEEKGVSSAIGSIWRFYDRNGYSFRKSSFMPPSKSARTSSKPVQSGA